MSKIETKLSEVRFVTSDPKRMLHKYVASNVVYKWNEECFDTEIGQTVSIERNELLFLRGTFISQEVLQSIRFYQDTGKIKEVDVSNQQRMARLALNDYLYPFKVVASISGKRKTFFVYAVSVVNAHTICQDYIELNFEGMFHIVAISAMGSIIILTDNLKTDHSRSTELDITYLKNEISMEEFVEATVDAVETGNSDVPQDETQKEKRRFYNIRAHIVQCDPKQIEMDVEEDYTFIVHTYSATRANMIIEKYLHEKQDKLIAESERNPDRVPIQRKDIYSMIEESKIVAANAFVPKEFSMAYYDRYHDDS